MPQTGDDSIFAARDMSASRYNLSFENKTSRLLIRLFTDWRRTARSIVLQKIFVCFLRTGGGPPGVLFYKSFFIYYFLKVYF